MESPARVSKLLVKKCFVMLAALTLHCKVGRDQDYVLLIGRTVTFQPQILFGLSSNHSKAMTKYLGLGYKYKSILKLK